MLEREPHGSRRGWIATAVDIELARQGLRDLDDHALDVCLVPAPDPRHSGHKVRAVCDRNPEWYRVLCRPRPARGHKRRVQSVRRHVVRALRVVVEQGYVQPSPHSITVEALDALAEAYWREIVEYHQHNEE